MVRAIAGLGAAKRALTKDSLGSRRASRSR